MKKTLPYFIIFLALFLFVFRSLISNISSNLLDWRDYAFVTWLINRNLEKIISGSFSGFANLNIFYPNTNTLFFSETLITQSLVALPFRFLTSSPIVIFNLVFITTFILNYFSVYYFWKEILNNNLLSFLGTLLLIFSPFFSLEIGHFQMLTYWPFFLSVIFLLKSYKTKKRSFAILSGLFAGVQFLASTYLAIFLLFTISLYALLEWFYKKSKRETIIKLSLVLVTFLALSGIFIKGYLDTKKQYSIVRDPNEFIQYSAHVSDYLFTSPINSIFHKSHLLNVWNSFDKHKLGGKAAFPGFAVTILALASIFVIRGSKKLIQISVNFGRQDLFFALLLFFGMVLSWGPRINFNGNYAHIPSLYYPFLKYIPFLQAARAPCRWSFLFYIGIIYFALLTLKRVFSKTKYTKMGVLLFLIVFFVEYIPTNLTTHEESAFSSEDILLKKYCNSQTSSLLEVPITHFDGGGGILMGLNRVVKYELSSLINDCYLINGYSGYDLPSLLTFKDDFYQTLDKKDEGLLVDFLVKHNVDILKINRESLSDPDLNNYLYIYRLLLKSNRVQLLDKDIFLVNPSRIRQ